MSRGVTATTKTAASDQVVRPILLFEGEFDSGTTRIWNGLGQLSALGETWEGGGDLINVTPIEETYEVKATGFSVSLSGISADNLNLALSEDYQNRTLTVYMGFIDESNALVDDPFILTRGRMDVMSISQSGEDTIIQITCETRMIDFERPRRRTYSDQDQRQKYPNDRGFEFVNLIQEIEIEWGRE
jgi:hypothetical protein